MSADADLAGLLADGADTVLLAQAGTPTEAGLIRERVAAAGGKDLRVVSLGTDPIPADLLEGEPGRAAGTGTGGLVAGGARRAAGGQGGRPPARA